MKIILPLSVVLPRKTKADRVWILNLNSYRNTHFQILNQAKKAWKDIVFEALLSDTMLPLVPYLFQYTIYPGSGRKFDLGNVHPVIQKFTDDALVEMGFIKDDDYKIIRAINYRFGGIDKENPRCELEILHWEETKP